MAEASSCREKINIRGALLEAAEVLFTQKGYAAVGTREIADAAGTNLGAIQYHFGTKAQLFVEVVRTIMHRRSENDSVSVLLAAPVRDAQEAATRLCRYIQAFLEDIFTPEGHRMCRLLFREIMSETSFDPEMREAIVSSTVQDFMAPMGDAMRALLTQIAPGLTATEILFASHTVFAQCMFYFSHQPFLERAQGKDYGDRLVRRTAARHIAAFTLRGLGCAAEVTAQAITAAFGDEFDKPIDEA